MLTIVSKQFEMSLSLLVMISSLAVMISPSAMRQVSQMPSSTVFPSRWIADRDTARFCVVHAPTEMDVYMQDTDIEGGDCVYSPIEWASQQRKNLRKVLLNSHFQYGGGGEQTTLRKLLNFQNFFTGEDALIR